MSRLTANVRVDGDLVTSVAAGQTLGSPGTTTFEAAINFAPAAATPHTLTVTLSDTCDAGPYHYTVSDLKLEIAGLG
jgi:hypothetical protein